MFGNRRHSGPFLSYNGVVSNVILYALEEFPLGSTSAEQNGICQYFLFAREIHVGCDVTELKPSLFINWTDSVVFEPSGNIVQRVQSHVSIAKLCIRPVGDPHILPQAIIAKGSR